MPLLFHPSESLYYTLSGPSTALTVVFSNSLGTNHTMWEAQTAALAAHFQVLCYDSRGHGQSAAPVGPYSVAQLGYDVLALLDTLALDRVHFCGLSLGGLVGQWLGIHAADRLHKLVLSNTAAKIGTAAGWDARIEQVQQAGLAPLAEATAGRWFTPAFQRAQPAIVQHILADFQATPAAGYAACCAAVRDADFRADLSRIAVPTRVLAGTHDLVTTVADGEYLAQQIPHAHLRVLPAAHLANVEASSLFTDALLEFFLA